MGIDKKEYSGTIPINDLPNDYFPPLPRAVVQRFPEMESWMAEVRDRFSVMQRKLWERDLELQKWRKSTSDSIASLTSS